MQAIFGTKLPLKVLMADSGALDFFQCREMVR
jgi:hypothetical protein